MLKDTSYQEKIVILSQWLVAIIDLIKKDLKNEHLKKDRIFCKKYFLGKSSNVLKSEEMAPAYRADIAEGNVGLAEFIATRWLLKNGDIYHYFESELKAYTLDFEMIDELPAELSEKLIEHSIHEFGAQKTYLFSVFNSVVFPEVYYKNLKELAEAESNQEKNQKEEQKKIENQEMQLLSLQKEVAAQSERYEKKLSGLQKKYLQDVDALKKQISHLHKKLEKLT